MTSSIILRLQVKVNVALYGFKWISAHWVRWLAPSGLTRVQFRGLTWWKASRLLRAVLWLPHVGTNPHTKSTLFQEKSPLWRALWLAYGIKNHSGLPALSPPPPLSFTFRWTSEFTGLTSGTWIRDDLQKVSDPQTAALPHSPALPQIVTLWELRHRAPLPVNLPPAFMLIVSLSTAEKCRDNHPVSSYHWQSISQRPLPRTSANCLLHISPVFLESSCLYLQASTNMGFCSTSFYLQKVTNCT